MQRLAGLALVALVTITLIASPGEAQSNVYPPTASPCSSYYPAVEPAPSAYSGSAYPQVTASSAPDPGDGGSAGPGQQQQTGDFTLPSREECATIEKKARIMAKACEAFARKIPAAISDHSMTQDLAAFLKSVSLQADTLAQACAQLATGQASSDSMARNAFIRCAISVAGAANKVEAGLLAASVEYGTQQRTAFKSAGLLLVLQQIMGESRAVRNLLPVWRELVR